MKIPLRTNVKVVTPVIVILISGIPLGVASTTRNLNAALVLYLIGALVFVALVVYFIWTMMLTRLEVVANTLTVTSPASTRVFILPDDIKKVVCDRRFEERTRDVYLENITGRYVFLEGKYLLPADSKLAVILDELERQVNAS